MPTTYVVMGIAYLLFYQLVRLCWPEAWWA